MLLTIQERKLSIKTLEISYMTGKGAASGVNYNINCQTEMIKIIQNKIQLTTYIIFINN